MPAKFHEPLDEAVTPTRADVLAAKQLVLETLATHGAMHTEALVDLALEREEVPPPVFQERLDLPPDGDPALLVRREDPQLARWRVRGAIRRALAELASEGVLLPVANPEHEAQLQVHSGGTSGTFYALNQEMAVAGAYELARPTPADDVGLLDADIYTAALADLLGERGVRCIDEALRAHRRGLHLAALNMLGAASEAAWYSLGDLLRDRSPSLAKALEEDRTASVIRQVHELLVQQRLRGAPRESLDELRSHATYLRELRNYGLHPRAEVSGDLEHHFTEHAASLTFMGSHRYFMRLAAIAASLAGAGEA